jgi:hypothetical protein
MESIPAEVHLALMIGLYLTGIIGTGLCISFGREAAWDKDRRTGTMAVAVLWPLVPVVCIIASPFLFAEWLGRKWG